MPAPSDTPRVHIVLRALDYNASGLLTGLSVLAQRGAISLTQEMAVPPPPLTSGPWHLRDKDDSNIEIFVDDRTSGFVDLHDSWELNADGIRDHDVYFKRSLDPARHPPEVRAKLEPLGLIYEVWSNGFDHRELARILTHKVPLRERAALLARYVYHLGASWVDRGARPNLRRTSAAPEPQLEPRVLFNVGLWDPRNVARHDPSRIPEFESINAMRANCVRGLRKALGASFSGGTTHSAFARQYAPDTLMPDPRSSSKRNYLRMVRRHPICITTTGLHGSNGCKLAEYVALSRAIVSEPLRYEVPGPFAPDSHYLPFRDPDECVRQVLRLVEDRALRTAMMQNNWDYYTSWMRPDAFARRVVERIRASR
jgi:hypothetical protein